MSWTVVFHEEFEPEFDELSAEIQDELYAEARFLEMFGPGTGRPHVDTLKDSAFAYMKELRFEAADGEWRVAFAFDPKRKAILLVAGDKSGNSERKFYKGLIAKADARYARHLERVRREEKLEKNGLSRKHKRGNDEDLTRKIGGAAVRTQEENRGAHPFPGRAGDDHA